MKIEEIEKSINTKYKKLLSEIERKNKFILEIITSTLSPEKLEKYIDDFRKKTELEIVANPYKLQAISMDINFITNDDWRESYEDLMTLATEGIAELKKTLYRNKSSFFVEHLADKKHKNLFIKVFSHAGANIEDIILETNNESNCNVQISSYSKQDSEKIMFSPDLNKSDCNNGKYNFKINKTLYSQRYLDKRIIKKTEGIYKFEIASPDDNFEIKKIRIFAKNSITGESFELPKEIKDKSIDPKLEIQEIKNEEKSTVTNYLSGKNEVTSDIIIKENETLVIKANSELVISPNVSIVVNKGKLILEGTPSQPIKIHAQNKFETWGTIAVQSGELEITNSIISGGSGKFITSKDPIMLPRVYYPSAITANYSKVSIRNSELNSADITLNNTIGSIENCTFVNSPALSIKQNNSDVKTSNIKINKNNTFQIDEEYKSFFGRESLDNTEYLVKSALKDISLKDLAKKVNKLTSSLVSNQEKMLSAKLLEGSYYSSITNEKEKGYFDVNLDTNDRVLDKNGIKYQVRYTFKKANDPKEYLFNPVLVQTWPIATHFETRISKDNTDKNKISYDKSIFDISDNSKPFNKDNPAPFQPWNIVEHVDSLKSGLFRNFPFLPAKHVLDSLKILNSTNAEINPQNVNITKELIQSLNIRSKYSSQLDEVFEIAVVMNERYPYKILDSLDNKDLRDQKEINYHVRITINKDYLKQLQSAITDTNKYNQVVLQLNSDLKTLINELEGMLRG